MIKINEDKLKRTNEEIEALRSKAYTDPLTGSDKLLNDYQASIALGADDAEYKKAAWLARRDEIKSEYPLNV